METEFFPWLATLVKVTGGLLGLLLLVIIFLYFTSGRWGKW